MISAVVTNAQEVFQEPETTLTLEEVEDAIVTDEPVQEIEQIDDPVDENDETVVTALGEVDQGVKLNNVTTESTTPNTTKVNCLANKEYGPVEV